jgi:GDPmannose 4,6-dehydratase
VGKQKTALITGITGQDGAWLARLLLEKNYIVHGMRPYSATPDTERLADLLDHPNLRLHHGDLTDGGSLTRILREAAPQEIYNLGAMSHVHVSFETPEATAQINALGTLRLLESLRDFKGRGCKDVRLYQASSSEMFGNAPAPQSEQSRMEPRSPYAAAKLYAYNMVRIYRESYGLFAANGILFNHESPVRGEEFVTRKITRAVAGIFAGKQDRLDIGNLNARRDWGHARDYALGMWMILQRRLPEDFVLATGEAHSVREFIEAAFQCVGITIEWRGEGADEKGFERGSGRLLVSVDPRFYRPNEVHELIGDAAKARRVLGWRPRGSFRALVHEMVQADLIEYLGAAYPGTGRDRARVA